MYCAFVQKTKQNNKIIKRKLNRKCKFLKHVVRLQKNYLFFSITCDKDLMQKNEPVSDFLERIKLLIIIPAFQKFTVK
jgi:hypothetical protein